MKAEIKIPVGWRRLRWGEELRLSDRFLSCEVWRKVPPEWGYSTTETIYIRKSKPTPSRKKGCKS